MLVIDGSQGEGGGQILRSSLALSLITGTPFRIEEIRAGRKRPGLMRQHLSAVRAAVAVSGAQVSGDAVGSRVLEFAPGSVQSGEYEISVGTAGSTGLVLQAVLPALALASGPSMITLRGGTHNPFAPPFDFLSRALLPLVQKMGPRVSAELRRPGFYPAGGGHAVYQIVPVAALQPLVLRERGPLRRREIVATVAQLSRKIAAREVRAIADALDWPSSVGRIVEVESPIGPGNVVTVDVESEAVTAVFTGFGTRGVRAETVAERVAQEVRDYLRADVPVGPYLADQLLLWLALAGQGAFATVAPTAHTMTHCDVIRTFLDVNLAIEARPIGKSGGKSVGSGADTRVWDVYVG